MEAAVVEAACGDELSNAAPGADLSPITRWVDVPAPRKQMGKRCPGGGRTVTVRVALGDGEKISHSLLASIGEALRADSPDAPPTHAEAVARDASDGPMWMPAEAKELGNHRKNASWVTVTRDELPPGRRVHKLIWVYKTKRDGTAKARLCVQGTTLEAGVDYDQVFSAALRYSSARALFAFAARKGCRVRSVDLVAAYLQGDFLEGESVYCHLPVGYPELDSDGNPLIAEVVKPIYGIQQAGRRLQRKLFEWLVQLKFTSADGSVSSFQQLDDSDSCVFVMELPDGETLALGLYVDNLQIVHSVQLDADGNGPAGSAYAWFTDKLAADWQVVDEGPMTDLLGIEVDYLADGSIKLHQESYVNKLVERFLPDGPLPCVQRDGLPYSKDFLPNVVDALAQGSTEHPELVRPFQQRVGSLMYACTSTRPDIAYPVHQLCRCLQKPTPALLRECDHVLSYLSRHASAGLTYTREHARLHGFSDASWETAHSTSGWVVLWQSAALTWGSRKQQSIALSTCEAEIIALSEATKDVVYLRKLVAGLRAPEPGPTTLATDSQSARDVSYNPEHHDRMKHVARRHFFVRDMVEELEIEVPFVRTADNVADFFTKPMKSASQFHTLRRVVMNEQ